VSGISYVFSEPYMGLQRNGAKFKLEPEFFKKLAHTSVIFPGNTGFVMFIVSGVYFCNFQQS